MRQYRSGHQAQDAVSSFMRGYQFIEGVKDREKQRRRDDTKWDQSQEDRKRTLAQAEKDRAYADATQRPADDVQQQYQHDADMREVDGKTKRLALDSAPTADQAQRKTRLGLDAQEQSITNARDANARAGAAEGRAAEGHDRKLAADHAMAGKKLMESPLGEHFSDPEFRAQNAKYGQGVTKGMDFSDGVSSPEVYEYATKLFTNELQKNRGGKLKDGSTLDSKRIVKAYEKDGKYILELAITAKRADGSTYEYNAPMTRNGLDDDTDEVVELSMSEITTKVKSAEALSRVMDGIEKKHGVQGREGVLAFLEKEYLESGGDPAKWSPEGGKAGSGAGSAKVQYLDFVAKAVFGGDHKKALNAIQGGDLKAIAAKMAGEMAKTIEGEGKSQKELFDEAMKILKSAESQVQSGGTIQAGHVDGGFRFKGGDPSDKANWEPAQ